jgi:Fe-S-cluster-containing hydrogenase component 2
MLPDAALTALEACKGGNALTPEQQEAIIGGLNEFIHDARLHEQLGKTRKEVLDVISGPQLEFTIAEYPKDTEKWSELEYRTFHRALLERLFPAGLPRQLLSAGPRRTLAYLGRGEIIGEMGVFTNPPSPRSATCVAYDHPDSGFQQRIPDGRMGAVLSRVELVKINRAEFEQMRKTTPSIDVRIRDLINIRRLHQQETQDLRIGDTGGIAPQSREFERLGLIQGQKLMLIDLDRCTRCNACVEACVASHEDGRTRLYLDGPRYDKFLVPLTCRKCLDPVCMIGCPVGSINRGENGEIIIRDWCIGCRMCADQCPYGSIQMNELKTPIDLTAEQKAVIGPKATLKAVSEQAVVCDLCSSLPSKDPSCCYACPHDAAFRINAQEFFFQAK